ncbi:MAG TPA: rRNA maturation RNase YbeY [Kiritimatiellia bacterium]|jgi:rRNA maturation RNase YbeY|nr:rRNA maturation RNase YbeY [Kiritimatiellia bacterium]HRU18744.1 rRNA maturation RNase YbeY [Kiritimatiellia bacterium]
MSSPNIYIRTGTRRFRLDTAALKRLAAALAKRARTRLRNGPVWREITIHLLDDAGITPVNAAILKHAGPTDVITQRYEPIPGEPDGLIGELFVNVERAARAAPRRAGWNADRELALYLAHGFDHLAGAEDRTPAERARMRRRELAWLRHLSLTPLFRSGTISIQNRSTREFSI